MNIQFIRGKFFALIVSLFVLFLAYGLLRGSFHSWAVLQRYTDLETRYAGLLKQNEDLQIRLTEVRSAEFIELNARDKLGLVKPGETAYKIIEED